MIEIIQLEKQLEEARETLKCVHMLEVDLFLEIELLKEELKAENNG